MTKKISAAVLGIIIIASGAAFALDFSADMTTKMGGRTMLSRVFVSGKNMRSETKAEGKTMISIMRGDKKALWTLMPEQKTYMENKLDPKQQVGIGAKNPGEMSRRKVGSERINGVNCNKYLITYKVNGKEMKMHQWISRDGWPMKSAGLDGSWSTEYKNFKKGRQPASLFELPKGYKKMSIPGMGTPARTTKRAPKGATGDVDMEELKKLMKDLPAF